MAKVLTNQETIDSWGCTETRYLVLLHLSKNLFRRKLLVVKDEDASPSKPLSVEFSPNGLAPTCVRNSKMDAIRREIMPEDACRKVSKSV